MWAQRNLSTPLGAGGGSLWPRRGHSYRPPSKNTMQLQNVILNISDCNFLTLWMCFFTFFLRGNKYSFSVTWCETCLGPFHMCRYLFETLPPVLSPAVTHFICLSGLGFHTNDEGPRCSAMRCGSNPPPFILFIFFVTPTLPFDTWRIINEAFSCLNSERLVNK